MNKILKKLLVFSIIFLIIPYTTSSNLVIKHDTNNNPEILEKACLIEKNGVKILIINGTNYEMGYQHGFLLREEVRENLRAFVNYSNIPMDLLMDTWNIMKNYVPNRYIDELQGLSDGAGISIDEVIAGYMVITREDMGCFGFSSWGDATVDGRLYHVRSFDQPLDIIDPITGKNAYENNMIIVRIPDDGIPSITPSIAGSLHSGGGMNAMGIALGQQVCWSKDQKFTGTPSLIKTQIILDKAENIDDVIEILINNKTLGWNYIISDAKKPVGYAVEISGNNSYLGGWNTTFESKKPFWEIKDVVRRTNFFIEPNMADTQRDKYNPGGFINFLKLVKRTDIFYAIWRSYKAISRDIERNQGKIDLNLSMDLIRDGYKGDTDPLLRLIVILAEGTSFNRAWNMWAADPLSGDLLVSFAHDGKIAFDTSIHHFNLYDLIQNYKSEDKRN